MGKTETKKKSPLLKIMIVVLALVVIANWDDIEMYSDNPLEAVFLWVADAMDGVLELGDQSHISGDWPDHGETDGTEQVQDKDILEAVPEHLRENYFLAYKEAGCCKTLTGSLYVTVVLINDSVSKWDDEALSTLQKSLNSAALEIVSEAEAYGVKTSLIFGYHYATLTGDICSGEYTNDWQDPALESAGLPALSQIHDHITEKFQVKEAPVVFAFNKESRAYASSGGSEFLVMFADEDFGSFKHEISHIFGAKDFYYPSEVKTLAEECFPESVMNTGKNVDPLTAYLIGWSETLSEDAEHFLEETNSITDEYMAAQDAIESFTGNGTKYTDYGTYTGDMVRGVFHGTGTMNYNDGGWYTGGWDNGQWSGKGSGKYFYSDGSFYEGDFLDGNRHGTGTYNYANGTVYTGSWSNGERHGTGTVRYTDGGWYTGGWNKGDKFGTGTGKEVYDNGVYEGAFLDGNRHGQGTYTWSSGDSYSGQWANGEKSGYGTYTWADGSSQSGTWQNGDFIG